MAEADDFPAIAQTIRRIHCLAHDAGRDPSSIQLIAVTKMQEPAVLGELAKQGLYVYGENRVDHLLEMIPSAPTQGTFHFIGRIQRRQYAKVILHCSCLHSFAELGHVETLVRASEQRRRFLIDQGRDFEPIQIFCQVNTGIEPHKAGVRPSDLEQLIDELRTYPELIELVGLMTMAPDLSLPEYTRDDVRACFADVRDLAVQYGLTRLSMGMSGDYDLAIQEGATDIRIGSALFQRG